MRIITSFDIESWDESTYDDQAAEKPLARAQVVIKYSGDLEGTGTGTMLLVYVAEGQASYTGLERIVGRVGERSGSFVLRHTGTFAVGVATTTFEVLAGSGTGDLAGVTGTGRFEAKEGRHVPSVVLDLEL
jgi:hypothetical protein